VESQYKSGGLSPEARATLEEKWAALSPDEQAKVEESLNAFQAEFARICEASGRYQKDLLRRLGVRTNIEDSEELWVQTLAAAEYVGVSRERFWKMTPRELAAVLEHRATELELLRRASPHRGPIDPSAVDLTATSERAARRQAVVVPILQQKCWKPGRLATEAGVGKNSVYQYLDGTRHRITEQNRKAIAEALGLVVDQLPD
jgi:transcriptional regulator with XRE-family HTH domain